MSEEWDEDISPKNDNSELRRELERDILADEESELDALVDSLLQDEDEHSVSDATERALRYAIGDDRESKASQYRMRSSDVTEEHLNQPRPETVNVEDGWIDPEKEVMSNRFFFYGGAVILLIIAAGVIWAAIELRLGDDVADKMDKTLLQHQQQVLQDKRKAQSKVAQLEDTARRYLAATTVEEKLKTVRFPERVKPIMMDYYSRNELSPKLLEEVSDISSFESEYRIYWVTTCLLKGEEEPKHLILSQSDDDKLKVLWEVDVVYQPMDWGEFIKQKRTVSTKFRVYVEAAARTGFYGYDFADYSKYRCFELRVEGSNRMLWGYTEIGSKADRALVREYRKVDAERPLEEEFPGYLMTLGVRYLPSSMTDKCVLIDEFVDNDWKLD